MIDHHIFCGIWNKICFICGHKFEVSGKEKKSHDHDQFKMKIIKKNKIEDDSYG